MFDWQFHKKTFLSKNTVLGSLTQIHTIKEKSKPKGRYIEVSNAFIETEVLFDSKPEQETY